MNKGRDFDAGEMAVFQKNEITEYHIYKYLSGKASGIKNRRILSQIADDEMRHYNVWKNYTRKDVGPDRFRVWFYTMVSMLFGFTFGLKLMENGEKKVHALYSRFPGSLREVQGIIREEEEHEQALLMLLDDNRLKHTGAIAFGLNDLLIEVTGVLAGLTLVFHNPTVVALTASITGIAATITLAASGSNQAEGNKSFAASLYTGVACMMTVMALIAPYLFFEDCFISLGLSSCIALCMTGFINYFLSVSRDLPFKSRFLETLLLGSTVAALSSLAGYAIHSFFPEVLMSSL